MLCGFDSGPSRTVAREVRKTDIALRILGLSEPRFARNP
jgi:hypothetical protein